MAEHTLVTKCKFTPAQKSTQRLGGYRNMLPSTLQANRSLPAAINTGDFNWPGKPVTTKRTVDT